jgi:hypothetical protein
MILIPQDPSKFCRRYKNKKPEYCYSGFVYTLEDILDREILKNIFQLLMQKIEGLTIIDEFSEIEIPPEELERLKNYMNDNFWIRIKEKKDFRMLQKKYDLNKTKDEIRQKLHLKFNELINSQSTHIYYKKEVA